MIIIDQLVEEKNQRSQEQLINNLKRILISNSQLLIINPQFNSRFRTFNLEIQQ